MTTGASSDFAWSPDAIRLAVLPGYYRALAPYYVPDFAVPIYVVDLHGEGGTYANGVHVSWSRTGWLAYRRGDGLYVSRPDGSQERLLAAGFGRPKLEVAPYAWSADGRRIAFARAGGIFVVRVDGGEPRALAEGYAPLTFSPDGRLIAFALGRSGSRTLVVKPVNGGRANVMHIRRSIDRDLYGVEAISGLDWQVRPPVR